MGTTFEHWSLIITLFDRSSQECRLFAELAGQISLAKTHSLVPLYYQNFFWHRSWSISFYMSSVSHPSNLFRPSKSLWFSGPYRVLLLILPIREWMALWVSKNWLQIPLGPLFEAAATPQRYWISGNEMHNKNCQRQQTNKSQSNCNKWQSDICQVANGRGQGRGRGRWAAGLLESCPGKCQLGKSMSVVPPAERAQWYPLQMAFPAG